MTGESASADREVDALRRVATLVARGVPPDEVFSAVSDEVGQLFATDTAAVVRFEHDPPAIVVVGSGKGMTGIPLSTSLPLEEGLASTKVYRTGHSARVDERDWVSLSEIMREAVRRQGVVSAVASPITVGDRLWGTINFSATRPLAPGTEARLERFSELIGIAIASADAQETVRMLADEQAALRRVATLVAQGVPPAGIFSAVSREVAQLFGEDLAAVGKFDVDGAALTIVGLAQPVEGVEIGMRIHISDDTPAGRVFTTGRPARVDRADWSATTSEMGQIARGLAIVSSVASPITVEGKLWGSVSALSTTKPLPPDTERRLERFSELIATAIANAESRSELAASGRRIVAASDGARRRIERDLHDGTQQRLLALALAVRAVAADAPGDLTNLHAELLQIAAGLVDAAAELQEISRGIHPANLSQAGLGAALRTLARRSPIPVDLENMIEGRLPEAVEVAAYYVTSEALANAAKHAQASRLEVSLTSRAKAVCLSIRDDGIGGADRVRGSGLVGLIDRIQTLGGTIRVDSPPGGGTHIVAVLPRELDQPSDAD